MAWHCVPHSEKHLPTLAIPSAAGGVGRLEHHALAVVAHQRFGSESGGLEIKSPHQRDQLLVNYPTL